MSLNNKSNQWNPKAAYSNRSGGLMSSLPPTASTSQLPPSALAVDEDDERIIEGRKRDRSRSVESNETETDLILSNRNELEGRTMKERAEAVTKGAQAVDRSGKTVVQKRNNKKKKKKVVVKPIYISTMDWPLHFKDLEKTFKALNTVYTFAGSRKSLSLTFSILSATVSDLLKRQLEIKDIAQIKSLLPGLITFAYIDKDLMRIHEDSLAERDRVNAKGKSRKDRREEVDKAYEKAAAEGGDSERLEEEEDVVLQFQFNDGELKSSNGVGKVITRRKFSRKKKKVEEVIDPNLPLQPVPIPETVPRYTTESMQALIAKRNSKFAEAVDELLIACAAHSPPLNPIDLLLEATEEFLPVKLGDDDAEGAGAGAESSRTKGAKERREEMDFYVRNPDKRISIEVLITELKEDEEYYQGQIVEGGHKIVDAREPVFGQLDQPLSESLEDALYLTKKIRTVYSHQAAAINFLHKGQNVIVSTSTSSGKTLVYQIPVVQAIEADNRSTSIFIFPTKALAQDQKRGLSELLANCRDLEDIKVATFDGDTPKEDRDYIRENASVIFTNPDMLHLTILPREESWRRFFSHLRFVVVDELHVYSGLFGVHVSFILRRLRRICAALGNRRIQFISCSATIANPIEHMSSIFGIDNIALVEEDGSPTGRKEYLIWNPPFIDPQDMKQGRVSTLVEASRLFRHFLSRGIRTIVFCKVRIMCEILMKQVRQDLLSDGRGEMADRVMSYRSGYSAEDRRQVERQMFDGKLLGVIATTALELGIDIGSLDAVITVGFPYTLPGLRQQAGRAGRRNRDSLALLILDPFPLDQFYSRNPGAIFDSPFSSLTLDLDNPIVLESHLQCAADELPVSAIDDLEFFGNQLPKICEDKLSKDEEGWYHCHPRLQPYPAKSVPIRAAEDENYSIIDVSNGRNKIIEEIQLSRAIFTIYEGAVFLHRGNTYLVKNVDHDRKLAKIQSATIEYTTRQRDFTNVDGGEVLSIRQIKDSDVIASYGTVKITSIVFGYFKADRRGNILDTVDISTPPFVRFSTGFWIDVPRCALDILASKNIVAAAAIHASEHALMSLTMVVSMTSEGDVQTECKQGDRLGYTRPSRIILYDASGKSSGVCAKAFDHVSLLLDQAMETIENCRCEEGCPACVASPICSGANTIVSKLGALIVLASILNREIDLEAIPIQAPLRGSKGDATATRRVLGRAGEMEEEALSEMEVQERERQLDELINGS